MSEALRAVEAEAAAPEEGAVYKLSTALGEADIHVPPPVKWRASARAALVETRVDGDLVWARSVLSADDFAEWMRCDPTSEESSEFLSRVFSGNGESLGKSEKSTGSSKSTRRK